MTHTHTTHTHTHKRSWQQMAFGVAISRPPGTRTRTHKVWRLGAANEKQKSDLWSNFFFGIMFCCCWNVVLVGKQPKMSSSQKDKEDSILYLYRLPMAWPIKSINHGMSL